MKSKTSRYVVYTLVIVLFMYLSMKVILDLQHRLSTEYTGIGQLYGVTLLIHLLFGLLLGADSLLREWAKEGQWSIRLPKLLGFVLPFFVLTVVPLFMVYGGVDGALPQFADGTMSAFANIALAYGVVTCFYKK